MKKIFLSITVIAAIGLVSCKKDRSCVCTTTSSIGTSSKTTTITDTKKKAATECDKGDASSSAGGYSVTTECELK